MPFIPEAVPTEGGGDAGRSRPRRPGSGTRAVRHLRPALGGVARSFIGSRRRHGVARERRMAMRGTAASQPRWPRRIPGSRSGIAADLSSQRRSPSRLVAESRAMRASRGARRVLGSPMRRRGRPATSVIRVACARGTADGRLLRSPDVSADRDGLHRIVEHSRRRQHPDHRRQRRGLVAVSRDADLLEGRSPSARRRRAVSIGSVLRRTAPRAVPCRRCSVLSAVCASGCDLTPPRLHLVCVDVGSRLARGASVTSRTADAAWAPNRPADP